MFLSASLAGSATGQSPVVEFAIREIVPPYESMTPSGLEIFQYYGLPFGRLVSVEDMDGDGLSDLWLNFKSPSAPELLVFDGPRLKPRRKSRAAWFIPWPTSWGAGSTQVGTVAPSRSPTGLTFATVGTPFPIGRPIVPSDYRLLFFNPQTRRMTDSMPLPTAAPPGLLPARSMGGPYPAGDLDADGFDELMLVAISELPDEDPIWILVDGATHTVRWANYYHPPGGSASLASIPEFVTARAKRWADIDGDGVGDPVVAYQTGTTNPEQWVLRCLSGMDGSLVWEYVEDMGSYTLSQTVFEINDIDGDGIGDIALRQGPNVWGIATISHDIFGYLRVVSGASGNLIWSVPLAPLDPGYVTGQPPLTWFASTTSTVTDVPDINGDGLSDIIISGREAWTASVHRFYLLSGLDGSLIETIQSDSSTPHSWWRSSAASGILTAMTLPVGDIDGDGWPEWIAGALDSNPAVPSGQGLTIAGIATLRGPEQAQEGDWVSLDIWIRTGAGLPFRLLISDAFSAYDGFEVGFGRDTHLAMSALLSATLGASPILGSLDANGKATVSLTIPIGAGLAGKRLYATGIIGDSTADDGIRCLTSVYSLEVLP